MHAYASLPNPRRGPPAVCPREALRRAMNGAGPRGPGGSSPRGSSYLCHAMQAAASAAASAAAAATGGAASLAGANAGYVGDAAGARAGYAGAGTAARRAVGPVAASASEGEEEEEEDNFDPDADAMAVERASAEQSAGTDSIRWQTPTKNKKSGVWQFFLQGAGASNRKQAKCKIDGCLKPVVMAQSTSNLTQHMHARHREYPPYLELKGQDPTTAASAVAKAPVAKSPVAKSPVAKSPAGVRGLGKSPRRASGMTKIMKKDDTATARMHARLILGFIVGSYESLDVVEEEQYRAMMRGFTNKPNMRIPCRKTMENFLTHTVMEAKGELKGMVADELVSLSCECWTSGSGVPMMSVTGHWVDKAWVLKSACLSVLELAGPQNGGSFAEALKGVLVDYGIDQENVTAVTTDTAANRKTAVLDRTGMDWLPCIGNVLEMVMDILIHHFAEVLDKVNTIVALVHHSQAALDKLCEAQKSSGLNEATLPESCPARWWSTIATVQAFFKNRAAVKLLCVWARDNEKDKLPTLTGYEWMLLADILVIASQWRQYQTRLKGEKHLTVSTLDIIVDGGFSVVSEASTNPALCKEVREVAALMETEMYKMFHPEDEVRPAHAPIQANNPLKVARMATVLDPRTKNAAWASPEAIEEFFYGPVEKELEVMMKAEEAAAQEEGARANGQPETSDESEFSLSRLIQKATDRRQLELEKNGDAPAAKVPRVDLAAREAVMSEWAMYKSSDITLEEVEHDGGPLAWWENSERLFPHLAKLARKYLAVQASSAVPERLFSESGLADRKSRNSLSDDTAADIIFLHEGMKHKLW